MKDDGLPAWLRRTPLDRPAPDAKAALDRLTATAVTAGWRKPTHPTFNSAV